jgi:CubicO group peptidase (beta-lactamase class C family)
MPGFETARRVLDDAIARRAFPGAAAEVGTDRDVLWRAPCGNLTFEPDAPAVASDTIYDLASLTKVIATASLCMREIERGSMGLDDRVGSVLAACGGSPAAAATIEDLLAHCAGFAAHRPYYQSMAGAEAIARAICETPLEYEPRTRSIYSDLGFMLLGFLLGRGVPLQERFTTMWTQLAPAEELQFLPPQRWKHRTAPTENDVWRGRLLVGEVHDENAAALGGVGGHAGLFGTAAAVGAFARHVLQVLDGRTGVFARTSLQRFVSRRPGIPGSSRALGWDTMLPTSSCGTRMSPGAFGHTGFTGTSLWIDPEAGVYVVLLTNRVYPSRVNEAIRPVRPAFHDAVMREVNGF